MKEVRGSLCSNPILLRIVLDDLKVVEELLIAGIVHCDDIYEVAHDICSAESDSQLI